MRLIGVNSGWTSYVQGLPGKGAQFSAPLAPYAKWVVDTVRKMQGTTSKPFEDLQGPGVSDPSNWIDETVPEKAELFKPKRSRSK